MEKFGAASWWQNRLSQAWGFINQHKPQELRGNLLDIHKCADINKKTTLLHTEP